jgi:Tol biopolymer transport system component
MRGRARVFAALLTLLATGGCSALQAISTDELPTSPIAVQYRTSEEARKHAEAMAKATRATPPPSGPQVVGSKANLHADLDALGGVLSEALGLRPPYILYLGRLALLDPRSGDVEVVASALPGALPLAWSPDRARLLFAQSPSPEGGDVQIFEWDRGADTTRRVTWAPPVHTQACYGPDGRIVATAVGGEGTSRRSWIRISEPGGRGPWRDLTTGPADHSPSCAADGGAVVFVRALEGGRSELRVALAPFDAASRSLAPGHHPRFAGQGDWIVYTARRGLSTRLARIRRDGAGRAPLGNDETEETWPAPSPDGAYVAFVVSEDVGDETPRRRLLVRRFDGSGDRVLLIRGEGEHPVW